MKVCNTCRLELPYERFVWNGNGYRAKCKDCYNKFKRDCYVKHPIPLKYSSEEERKEAARVRAREWYKNNTNRAKNRIYSYNSLRENKDRRNTRIAKDKIKRPNFWRLRKKNSSVIRRCRELNAGRLSASSLSTLECYNTKYFSFSSFTCEYCSSIIGNNYHLEHLVPLSRNGTNDINNLAISCPKCNLEKSNKTVEEYRPDLVEYFKNRKI